MNHLKSQTPYGSPDTMHYYSAPSSPIRRIGSVSLGYESENPNGSDDFFEFSTFQDFCNESDFDDHKKPELSSADEGITKEVKRGGSLPTMAFADELFYNGQLKPLKLPPRLQHGNERTCRSQTMSPTSSVIKIPFARRNMWNDDFDPFTVALQKVRDDKRARKSVHRRARSHSPFRTTNLQLPADSICLDESKLIERDSVGPTKHVGPIEHGLAQPKGTAYARWARNGSMGHKKPSFGWSNPKARINFRVMSFGRKVEPVKAGQKEPIKPKMKEAKNTEESERGASGDTHKMQKVQGILLKYALFGKHKSEGRKLTNEKSSLWKLSFKFKGSGPGNGQKKVVEQPKMVIVPYKPNKFTLCLGSGGESPRI